MTYVHVELGRHDLLLAEGLAAESCLDTGNRGLFAAEAGVRPLFSEFRGHDTNASQRAFAERGCAPLLLGGPALARAHARLLARAVKLGHVLTDDSDLRVLSDGDERPVQSDGPRWHSKLR